MKKFQASTRLDLRDLLHEHGLRYSKPREVILGYFRERDKHASAETLYLDLKERGHHLSLSTVYLNLGVLKDAQLIREFPGSSGESLYDSNLSPHNHLICKTCGVVLDLPLVEVAGKTPAALLQRHAQAASGWQVDEPNLELFGVCPTCQAEHSG